MPISPLPQAPYRQDRKNLVTPIVGDILFSEIRDCNRTEFPEYGTAHPNPAKWPHHKLCYIKPVDIERNEIFEFYYCADRENQDLYNFEFSNQTITGVAGRKLRTVIRTYVTPRADFDANIPEFNSVMPNEPAGQFDVVYYFFEKEQARVPDKELDSLYIIEKRSYVDESLLTKPVSISVEKGDLTPAKFRFNLPTTTEDQVVAGDVTTPVLTGNQIASSEDQLNSFTKEVKTITRTPQSGDITLTGSKAYVEGTVASVSETLSTSDQDPDSGVFIVQSEVTPIGDGRFLKETVSVDEWPTLINSDWDHALKSQVVRTDTFIASTDIDTDAPFTSYRAVNKDRTLQSVEVAPTDTLTNYLLGLPTRIDLKLPNILRAVEIIISEGGGNGQGTSSSSGNNAGESYAISTMGKSESSSSSSIKPDLLIDIEQPWGSDLPVMVYYFYIEAPNNVASESDVLYKLSTLVGATVNSWPYFEPVSKTVILRGSSGDSALSNMSSQEKSFSKKSASQNNSSSNSNTYRFSLNIDTVTLPPTLHKGFVFTGLGGKSITLQTSIDESILSSNLRYRFSVDFDALKDQIITLWPSGHKFYCAQTIVTATSFSELAYGVYATNPYIVETIPNTSDSKVYIGGAESDVNPTNGDERLKFSEHFLALADDTVTMYPSQISFLSKYDVVDATVFTTALSGVVVDSILNVGESLLTTDTHVVVNQRYFFDADFTVNAGQIIVLSSGHSFTCDETTTTPTTTGVKIRKIDFTNALGGADTIVSIGGVSYGSTTYFTGFGPSLALSTVGEGTSTRADYLFIPTGGITASALQAEKQTPITTSFLESEIPVLSSTTTLGTPNQITALVSPNFVQATNPTDIPRSGMYMVQSRVEPYKWNWLKCMAVVLDASQFAKG